MSGCGVYPHRLALTAHACPDYTCWPRLHMLAQTRLEATHVMKDPAASNRRRRRRRTCRITCRVHTHLPLLPDPQRVAPYQCHRLPRPPLCLLCPHH